LRLDLTAAYSGSVDPWYEVLTIRDSFKLPLTALQVAAEQTPIARRGTRHPDLAKERAEREKATFYRVEVRDFVKQAEAAHLPELDTTLTPRPSASLKLSCEDAYDSGPECEKPGIALGLNRHHVLEVKALRACSPIFSRDKAFCAINAYHLSVMCMLSYADFHVAREPGERPTPPPYKTRGAIGTVLQSQLACAIKPTCFEKAEPYHLLLEEVPYSKRLEVMPYDPARYTKEAREGWEYPEHVHFLHDKNETQAFITHNDKVLVLSVRGTAGGWDTWRDIDARQVPHENGVGHAHRGFYKAFIAAKKFVSRYMDAFYTDQTILVCGHSLGGAISTLLAEWLNRSYPNANVILYTYGSPRVGNSEFVKAAAGLTHHRLVNHHDPIPGVPSTWMDGNWQTLLPGTAMLVASVGAPLMGAAVLLGGLMNLRGDDYEHHGEQRHFMPRKAGSDGYSSILWKPGCDALEQKICAEFAGRIDLQGDMPNRSMLAQLSSFSEHSSNAGYSRAALTTLVRWAAAARERDGRLFTDKERGQISGQIDPIDQDLAAWPAPTYLRFRRNVRTTTQPRLYRLTELQLRDYFNKGHDEILALRSEQRKGLSQAQQRLKAQATVPVTLQDVFGDQANREDIEALLGEWLQLADIQKAAQLAKIVLDSTQKIA
jgi:pimeloyl-ACP methyl ester carboxylesterase